jgi:hypothetical protein
MNGLITSFSASAMRVQVNDWKLSLSIRGRLRCQMVTNILLLLRWPTLCGDRQKSRSGEDPS